MPRTLLLTLLAVLPAAQAELPRAADAPQPRFRLSADAVASPASSRFAVDHVSVTPTAPAAALRFSVTSPMPKGGVDCGDADDMIFRNGFEG